MTRKDFQLIAGVLKGCLEQATEPNEIKIAAHAMAGALRWSNPLFDRTKFLEACGIPRDEQWPTT